MTRFFPGIALLCCLVLLFACDDNANTNSDAPVSDTAAVVVPDPVKPDTVVQNPMPELEQIMIEAGLVNIQSIDSTILVDLKYSTTDNFLGVDVYGDLTNCYLRPLAAEKLAKAQAALKEIHPGFSLLVFDGARPRRVQYLMWDTLKIPNKINYVANPDKGSIHNYGMAVDLSIADSLGNELDMGTEFDFFGELAQPQLQSKFLASGELTNEQINNRALLNKVMKKGGFYPIKTEWWHFVALLSNEVKANYQMIE